MTRKVLILDTSVLCCLLNVPGKDTCGPSEDRWDKIRIEKLLNDERGSTIVLPLATIIETGNHIAQSNGDRYPIADRFCDLLKGAANGTIPWAAFSEQVELWSTPKLIELAGRWPDLAVQKISLGDATILDVAEYYARSSIKVEIITGDAGLKAYESTISIKKPRRRQ